MSIRLLLEYTSEPPILALANVRRQLRRYHGHQLHAERFRASSFCTRDCADDVVGCLEEVVEFLREFLELLDSHSESRVSGLKRSEQVDIFSIMRICQGVTRVYPRRCGDRYGFPYQLLSMISLFS